VKTPEGSLEVRIPKGSPTNIQAITWIKKDLGPSVLALFKNYRTNKDLWGQTFRVVTAEVSFAELAEIIQKGPSLILIKCQTTVVVSSVTTGIGKPVSFTSPATSGVPEVDEMVCMFVTCPVVNVTNFCTQYEYFSEFGMYRGFANPDPRLIALGVQFSTLEGFAEAEMKPRSA
jgi:hypothetical protein